VTTDAVLRRQNLPAAFDGGAAAYDRLVGVNPGYHAHLRLSARRMRVPGNGRGMRLLSVLDRYDRQAGDCARRHHGSVIELHAYAAPADPVLGKRTVERLHALYPETGAARTVAESVVWREDCPLAGVGDFARRPRVVTPFPGLVLAGDGIRIDLPVALMERGASTGWHAANCLLARWGLAGHTLYSVPTGGRLAPLRWLAARGADNHPQREGMR